MGGSPGPATGGPARTDRAAMLATASCIYLEKSCNAWFRPLDRGLRSTSSARGRSTARAPHGPVLDRPSSQRPEHRRHARGAHAAGHRDQWRRWNGVRTMLATFGLLMNLAAAASV